MSRRKIALAAAAVAIAAGTAFAAPATAVPGGTAAYFTITGGGLAVSAPQPDNAVDLGSVSSSNVLSGGSLLVSGKLGNVTVTDERGALVAAWTATVSATDFVHQDAGIEPVSSEMVSKANISYLATDAEGLLTGATSSGLGTFVPGIAPTLALPGIAGTWAGAGANSVSWNPTVSLSLLQSQVAGRYDGVITHSVA